LGQTKIAFSNWADPAVPVVKRHVEELREWHEQLAALRLLNALRNDAIRLEHDSAEQFAYLADMLSAQLRTRKGLDAVVPSLKGASV
jgi:hypothetical protein